MLHAVADGAAMTLLVNLSPTLTEEAESTLA